MKGKSTVPPEWDDELGEVPDISLPVLETLPKGDKFALVSFDGTGITEQGNVVKHNWFKGMEIDSGAYSGLMLTPKEAQALKAAHQRTKIGSSIASVMTCQGPSCPIAGICPFMKLQKEIDTSGEVRSVVPIGKLCPVEQDIMFNTVSRLSVEFGVGDEPGSFTDQRILLELGEIEVLEHRMNGVLATKYPELSEQKLVSVIEDELGIKENYVKDIADAMKVKEKLWARKDKLRKELVATRLEQRKLAALEGEVALDASSIQASLLEEVRKLSKR
jgi:hypothetical protein